MEKIVSLLLALALIFNLGITAFADEPYTISLSTDETSVNQGETVYVYVGASQAKMLTGAQVVIEYDEDLLQFDEAASEPDLLSKNFTAVKTTENGNDLILVTFQSVTQATELAGNWCKLAFQTLNQGSTEVSISEHYVYDEEWNDVTVATTGAVTFTITEPSTNVAVTGVTLNKTELSLTVGATETLTVTVAPENATNKAVTWTTDKAEVATVADGVVSAVAEGTATITATTVDSSFTASCTVTVTAAAAADGYTVSMKESSVTTAKGSAAAVDVMVSGHSDEEITGYNDYDVYVTYDSTNLTFNVDASSAADSTATIEETGTGTIRITGHGDKKEFTTAVAALNFTANASGAHNVTITSAKVDNSGNAISNDAPEAAIGTATTVIKVPYSVELPTDQGFISEQTSVLPGDSFTFTVPSDAAYYDITVTVGGNAVTPGISGNDYTITGVDGDVVVSAVGKTYNVTANTTATFNGNSTAQYGTDYTFTVTASEGKVIKSVTATVNGTEVAVNSSNGQYVIAGKSITGNIIITITEETSGSTETETTITISGVDETEVVGGLTQTATVGQPFTFSLNKVEGYTYVVKVGDTVIEPNEDGTYTIPGSMVIAGGVTVTIEKTVTPAGNLQVAVVNYIQLDGKVMWLVTATDDDKVLAYGDEGTMFWSEKYGAYCWLVISAESENAVKTAAQAAITEAAEGAAATAVAYDKDVNQTTVVDINDAQLTYDMYQAKAYGDFTNVTMDKFLEADVNADKTVNTEDVAAIVAAVLGK